MCLYQGAASIGAAAADDILDNVFGVTKALNPQNHRDFLIIQRRIAQKLQSATLAGQTTALRSVLGTLDVDWPNLSAAQRDRIINAARLTLRSAAAHTAPIVEDVLSVHALDLAAGARAGAIAAFDLSISSSLSLGDERLASWAASSQSLFVRDRFGVRADAISVNARRIVAEGLDSGYGRDEIASRLGGLVNQGLGGGPSYWNIVSGAFVGRTRSAINVSAFGEAGVAKFRVDAVLDEVTSEVCRFLHGREYSVKRAGSQIAAAQAAKNPEDIRSLMPWVNKGKGDENEDILYYGSAADPQRVATIDSFGEGEKDTVGEYSGTMSDAELEAAGITTPPFHTNCRTTIIAVV